MPIVWYRVASIICGVIAFPLTSAPRASLAPTTCPIFNPPPAMTAMPAWGQCSRPAFSLLIRGFATHLARHQDSHVLFQAAVVQVGEQGTQGLIDHRDLLPHHLKVVDVGVPAREVDAHYRDASLDQSAGL